MGKQTCVIVFCRVSRIVGLLECVFLGGGGTFMHARLKLVNPCFLSFAHFSFLRSSFLLSYWYSVGGCGSLATWVFSIDDLFCCCLLQSLPLFFYFFPPFQLMCCWIWNSSSAKCSSLSRAAYIYLHACSWVGAYDTKLVRKAAGIYLCFALEQWVDHQQLRAGGGWEGVENKLHC